MTRATADKVCAGCTHLRQDKVQDDNKGFHCDFYSKKSSHRFISLGSCPYKMLDSDIEGELL
jgi:hypothetical protein